jgi:hypothetical protein
MIVVTILIAVAGQSGTSEEQSMMVVVIVLKTVEVVRGIEVSRGKAGGAVDNSIVGLDGTEGLSEAVGATMVEDSPIVAELTTSLVEGTELISALVSGIVDSAVAADDASEEATALDEETAVSPEDVGTEAG